MGGCPEDRWSGVQLSRMALWRLCFLCLCNDKNRAHVGQVGKAEGCFKLEKEYSREKGRHTDGVCVMKKAQTQGLSLLSKTYCEASTFSYILGSLVGQKSESFWAQLRCSDKRTPESQ